jgi:hypothetical protein
MMKTVLVAAVLIGGLGLAAAQVPVPGNKNEAASPAPPAQQNAPPDKVAPAQDNPAKAPPDTKAERDAPALKMDSPAEKRLPGYKELPDSQEQLRSPP